ncbi:heme-binding protein [Parasphingopyxis sp. CP4]|uniref:heme-binding protein n=1 Tax=Parasphingopyxis sp. CP4 TaxID=2724527 RepID=UPI0015A226BC|nr:heme-binding protein [Parasphingopyxis sp. CP4]QLC21314.1 heme-binding protein [Parasphingopyxis sp. CP4]
MKTDKRLTALLTASAFALAACGGGGSGGTPGNTQGNPAPAPPPPPPPAVTQYAVPAQESLSAADVRQVIAQAAGEATARGLPVAIAVVDRVGNVLAVYAMTGADLSLSVPSVPGTDFDLQGRALPAPAAAAGAIAKAITGAYLSSGGNAFSTRTASEIVQEHFPPAPTTVGLESGPLFGVQFSALPCSDLVQRFTAAMGADALIGPKRSPLGLSADPGGFPLYRNGVVIGGVGVMGDGIYGFDPNRLDNDNSDEEAIGLAATNGFEAPRSIQADRIPVDGTTLKYSDADTSDFQSDPNSPPAFAAIAGSLVSVAGYYDMAGGVLAGTAYGAEASGIRASTAAEFSIRDAFVLSDGSGANRFPLRAGTDGADVTTPLTLAEVTAVLEEAFIVMRRARAQIRRPLDSRAEVTISVVDTHGEVLGIVRSPDAPIFGIDVSLQKARTATFFSGANAATLLQGNPSADVVSFVQATRDFLGDPNALTGAFAFSDRAGGNLSRPYFPDGEVGRPQGPLSRPIDSFNPFSTGLQSALILDNILTHVGFIFGMNADTPPRCTATPDVAPGQNPLENGIQIFPGSVPIYRGNALIGGIGVSGDGIDQDDMISFLGTHNASVRVGGINNAAPSIRADRITVDVGGTDVRLRYVNCPFAPFLDTDENNVCQGL